MSDRDQAISHVIHSAYSNCGQKCSATSLLILEREVYEDEKFKRQLVDAARSYAVGTAWGFRNRMGPLIQTPEGPLKRALTRLEPGNRGPSNLKTSLITLICGHRGSNGVQPGNYTHMTEFFGPVLGVMCVDDLNHAIDLVNQTGYGLTSGQSLDERSRNTGRNESMQGIFMVNRVTTGAIVLRQPLGAWVSLRLAQE